MSDLKTLYTYSLNLNGCVNLSLVRDMEAKYLNNRYFFFLSLAPRSKTSDGNFTYDFKNSINLKVAPLKIGSLGAALSAYGHRQSKTVGSFGIFVDTTKSKYSQGAGSVKSVYLSETQDKKNNEPTVLMGFKSGNQSYGVSMPATDAIAFGDVCTLLHQHVIKLGLGEVAEGDGIGSNSESSNRHSYNNSYNDNNNYSNRSSHQSEPIDNDYGSSYNDAADDYQPF